MRGTMLGSLLAVMLSLARVEATTVEDFKVPTTEDLIDLCTVGKDEPLHEEAIHFCHGYLVGAYHFQESMYAGPKEKPLVCPPDPRPTRDQAVQQFVVWVRAHPQYKGERPVDTLMRFLTETWPCK